VGANDERREVREMLTLEIIGVLGALLGLLVYGMVSTQLARRQAEAKEKAEKGVPSTREEVR
jgi:Na+-translocating ferredoxin:NAD+ oxidoreductase RnfG subunit